MRTLLPCLLLLASCGKPVADDGLTPPTCDAGARRTGVITQLLFARPDEQGRIDGFDLDEAVTVPGNASGCGRADDLAPDGTPGVDAAFNKLLPALELTEAQAVEEIIQELINNGEVLIMWDLAGVDDPADDTCATLDLLRGQGAPRIGGKGRINPGQTFDVHAETLPVDAGEVSITDGTFSAEGFAFQLPFSFLGTFITLNLQDVSVRVTMNDDGSFQGALSGGIVVSEVLAEVEDSGIAREVLALLQSAVSSTSDLAPDENGQCTQMSAALVFTGVTAFLYEGDAVDTGGADTDAPADTDADSDGA